jgi:hypothetical protein
LRAWCGLLPTLPELGHRRNAAGRLARLGCRRLSWNATWNLTALIQKLKLTLLSHRVPVFPAEEALVGEDVQVWRKGARELTLIELDGVRVLLAPEDQFRFELPFYGMAPDGHGSRHQDVQHRNGDQQRGHRVAGVTPSDATLTL